jgi:hypothetical protein
MTPFRWNFRGIIAWGRGRADVEEFNGWWRHVAFGVFVFKKKPYPHWEADPRFMEAKR